MTKAEDGLGARDADPPTTTAVRFPPRRLTAAAAAPGLPSWRGWVEDAVAVESAGRGSRHCERLSGARGEKEEGGDWKGLLPDFSSMHQVLRILCVPATMKPALHTQTLLVARSSKQQAGT